MSNDNKVKDTVEKLRCAIGYEYSSIDGQLLEDAADAIESLTRQLAEVTAERDAAVEDIYKMKDSGECDICKHYNPDKNTCAKPFVPYDDCFEWRGPQEAGKGSAE